PSVEEGVLFISGGLRSCEEKGFTSITWAPGLRFRSIQSIRRLEREERLGLEKAIITDEIIDEIQDKYEGNANFADEMIDEILEGLRKKTYVDIKDYEQELHDVTIAIGQVSGSILLKLINLHLIWFYGATMKKEGYGISTISDTPY
nr:apple-like protein [Tanacetum cinerariifolium]